MGEFKYEGEYQYIQKNVDSHGCIKVLNKCFFEACDLAVQCVLVQFVPG
jgi:hypothetical protein